MKTMIINPPTPVLIPKDKKSVFLAGSIEMGKAEDWQESLITSLNDWEGVILNPRRPEWDSTWEQSMDNPHFVEQVNWELDGLEKADLIITYFAPNTQSPITLLELGLFANSKKIKVCCPKGFWRKGNIDIVCARFGIEQVNHYDDFVEIIQKMT
jgi:hypothetical protein